jgi:predicted nucleotidyltransferase
MRRVGKALSYSVDGGHAVVQQILAPAFEREDRLVEQYADEARRGVHVPLKSVILFGSVARGEEEERSDVDLLFVTRDERTARAARERTWEVMSDLARRYGNVPQIIVVSRQAFRARVRRNHPLFLEILKTGRVLYGCPFGELFAHGA